MALLVNCECGERVIAEDSEAGQPVPCPACGKMVEMPQAYNPLSTAKYVQAAAEAPPPPVEEVRPTGPPCPDCDGTGHCRHCHGSGQMQEAFLDRLTNGITNTITGIFTSLGDMLGGGPRRSAHPDALAEARGQCLSLLRGQGQVLQVRRLRFRCPRVTLRKETACTPSDC